ncbi:serine/threonine-protein phosphatase 2A regulatory subunit B'' subunit beta-like isoform X2 [Mytilus californianus]|uniref:serine/threonine-protein phosphatase 2A regulatory subunit B'' subunit beta-like isoform X2 n=1 Tax=Mytilus californianus TaxID=6549 RepID=UPI00224722A5|nr:serine/threonine-protein phosphatase 2A regulatory subunit B'' subunit beta-like isoform X2 [Mytilus californianus]
MALKPVLKLKVDELFLRWLSEPETQNSLKENLRQLTHGEALTTPLSHYSLASPRSSSGKQSPRLRPTSPPFSPPTSKLPSPRSPRRPLSTKNNHRNGGTKTNLTVQTGKDVKEIIKKDNELIKERDKENKELSPSLTTATSTITTVTDTSKDTKRHDAGKTLQNVNIPKFYYPYGKPINKEETEKILDKVSKEFSKLEGGKAFLHNFGPITKVINLPLYWKSLLYTASGGNKNGYVTFQMFAAMWRKVFSVCHDAASRFVKLLTVHSPQGRDYVDESDLIPLVQDIVETHPGLTFLQEAPEFHSRYVNTVIARILYCVNRSWSGKITVTELRKSNFLSTLALLEEEDDINQVMDFFSYEHFYVIYCKFWELDKDHDLLIDKHDLARHNDHAVNSRTIERIFSGAVIKGKNALEGKMSYPQFVCFLLSEEDKRNPTSVEYWFRVMDLDGDGVISMYEMEYFYEEQMQKMEALGIEKLPFEDCLCQMLDLVRPKDQERITLADLKNCKMTHIFFDTFINLDKFLDHEQRDPFSNMRDVDSDIPEPSDWERYAAEEYELLVAEEGANDQEEVEKSVLSSWETTELKDTTDTRHYEDDFEPDEDEIVNEENKSSAVTERVSQNSRALSQEDDIYDFSTDSLGY